VADLVALSASVILLSAAHFLEALTLHAAVRSSGESSMILLTVLFLCIISTYSASVKGRSVPGLVQLLAQQRHNQCVYADLFCIKNDHLYSSILE